MEILLDLHIFCKVEQLSLLDFLLETSLYFLKTLECYLADQLNIQVPDLASTLLAFQTTPRLSQCCPSPRGELSQSRWIYIILCLNIWVESCRILNLVGYEMVLGV